MVTKFLTREQTYAQLLSAVSENEKKLDKLRRENDLKQEQLHGLQIDNNNQTSGDSIKVSAEGQEISDLHKEIQQLKKDKIIINDRQKNINLACDQVNGWSNKVVNKLNIQLGSEFSHMFKSPLNGQESMSETFQQITDVVCNKLAQII